MIKNIITLLVNDLAISLKNKTFFLIFFIPLFVFSVLKIVDTNKPASNIINLGLIEKVFYPPMIVNSLAQTPTLFHLRYVKDGETGKQLLKEKNLDALLLKDQILFVLKKESMTTISTLANFQALQKSIEKRNPDWILKIESIQNDNMIKQSFPTWILMLTLLVGFIILPAQVAEEKEKKLLLCLLQTPMREIEWLMAKVILGIILTMTTIFLLHLLNQFNLGMGFSYTLIILIGSFCFTSFGILLGFLCRNHASARILGVVFYLPLLLPSALSDFSSKLTTFAPILPSFQFYESVKLILFDHASIYQVKYDAIYLFIIGILCFFFSYHLIKKRWLM